MHSSGPVPFERLTVRQQKVLTLVTEFYEVTGEPCSASYVSRRLSLHHSTIQVHLSALYRKGWLRTPNAPAVPFLQR